MGREEGRREEEEKYMYKKVYKCTYTSATNVQYIEYM